MVTDGVLTWDGGGVVAVDGAVHGLAVAGEWIAAALSGRVVLHRA
ncbi:MAG: hypothetical protein R3F59_32385 [Myxococcota bacterium]